VRHDLHNEFVAGRGHMRLASSAAVPDSGMSEGIEGVEDLKDIDEEDSAVDDVVDIDDDVDTPVGTGDGVGTGSNADGTGAAAAAARPTRNDKWVDDFFSHAPLVWEKFQVRSRSQRGSAGVRMQVRS
jgi:hypothetical protein